MILEKCVHNQNTEYCSLCHMESRFVKRNEIDEIFKNSKNNIYPSVEFILQLDERLKILEKEIKEVPTYKEINWSEEINSSIINDLRQQINSLKMMSHLHHNENLCSSAFNVKENKSESILSHSGTFKVEKKTGLSFIEAIKLCKEGKRLKRIGWKDSNWSDGYMYFNKTHCTISCLIPGLSNSSNVHYDDMLSNDWEIVE